MTTVGTEAPPRAMLTVSEWMQTIYTTGQMPDGNRPTFDNELQAKLVEGLEKFVKGCGGNIAPVQSKIDGTPALAALLHHGSEQSEPGQAEEDKRFTSGHDGKRLIKLFSIEEIYALPAPTYLIPKVLTNTGISFLYGMSGTGKTFSCLDMSLCIAHGAPWMGRRVKQGTVWYVNTEGGSSLGKRIKAWYIEHALLSPTSAFKIIPWSLDLRENFNELLDTIDAMSENEKPTMIVLDNFSMCTAGINQNAQEEVAPILRTLNELSQTHDCHVMVVHHTNKEGDFNGTMAFRNHVDTMIELKKEDKADKNSPILFCSQKTRDDEPFSDIKTELKQIVLYTDDETLEEVTSCVVVASETPIKSEGLRATVQDVLDILSTASLIHSDWQKECVETLKISTATFERCRRELTNKGHIEKYKPQASKVDHYRRVITSSDPLQGYKGDNE